MTEDELGKILKKYSYKTLCILWGFIVLLMVGEFFIVGREFSNPFEPPFQNGYHMEIFVFYNICLFNTWLAGVFVRNCLFDIVKKLTENNARE